jgi:nucleoside-diphosphate-sugar epimerase
LDVVTLDEVMQGVAEVYHCAAIVSFRKKDYQFMLRVNKKGTANIVNCALSNNVERFCFVSSTAAVGKVIHPDGSFGVEERNKWVDSDNHSGYAVTKYLSENEVWRGVEEGLNAVIINPSVIIGPGNWDESSLTLFKTMSKGLLFYTNGANAFVDVRDVVLAMRQLMSNQEHFHKRYLCTGTNISFKNLFEIMAIGMKRKAPPFLAGRFLSAIAWRISWVLSLFTGIQSVTKESANSAQAKVNYNSSKLINTLNFNFRSVEDTVIHAIDGRIK